MSACKYKEHGNGPLPLSNACKSQDHNSSHGSSLHRSNTSLISNSQKGMQVSCNVRPTKRYYPLVYLD